MGLRGEKEHRVLALGALITCVFQAPSRYFLIALCIAAVLLNELWA